LTAGIGCHGKILDYLKLSGFYSLHGRALATAQGIKLANPDLKVVAFVGDGDALGEGIAHLIFAAKRNAGIAVIVHDNGVYGLTTGQYTPTSKKGFKGPSTPQGSVEEPLNPVTLMLEAGATFVARGYSGRIDHLAGLIAQAVEHEGFSFIDVLQPCVSYNDTYREYNKTVALLEAPYASREAASQAVRTAAGMPIGVFFRQEKPAYHREILGGRNPVTGRVAKAERQDTVNSLIIN
jgi:2-oxoglutarate ferredoxin oxidoreductase subunit beta